MELNPRNIKEHIGELGTKEASSLLMEWILNSNEQKLREKALEILGNLDKGNHYTFFEQLFLSDANIKICLISGKILKDKYIEKTKLLSLTKYVLEKVELIEKKLLTLEILKKINNRESWKLLKDYLQNSIKSIKTTELSEYPEKIFLKSHSPINEDLIVFCLNIILYDYFIKKCGFNVTLRGGKIILLNCEGSGFGSIDEIPVIERLTDLEHLILKRNKITNIYGLNHLENLQILDLSHNKLKTIDNLDKLQNLKELNLSNNQIKEIKNVNNLQSIQKVTLDHNQITEISEISGLSNLEDLNLNNNKITVIKGLIDLPKLEKLNLSFNDIKKISGLDRLRNLHWLHLNNNQIEKIEGLENLNDLKGLYLSNNNIQKIENLDTLIELRKIELSNNKIKEIEGLDTLHKLQELFLDNNKIKEIRGIDALTQLIILFLKSNEITHFNNEKIEKLQNLNFIFLNDNPLTPESKICYNRRSRYP